MKLWENKINSLLRVLFIADSYRKEVDLVHGKRTGKFLEGGAKLGTVLYFFLRYL